DVADFLAVPENFDGSVVAAVAWLALQLQAVAGADALDALFAMVVSKTGNTGFQNFQISPRTGLHSRLASRQNRRSNRYPGKEFQKSPPGGIGLCLCWVNLLT